jgi:SecD-like export protein
MNTITELLEDADPLWDEPPVSSRRRDASRQAVLAAAFAVPAASPRFSVARLAMVSVVVIAILLLGSRLLPPMGFETHADVRFEVRLAETAPGPGLREARIAGTERVIYLHEEIVVSNGDIDRAEMLPGREGLRFVVGVHFTPEGARKMNAATQNHIDRPIAILVDGEVVMAPTVRSTIGDSAEINGNYTREQAERIVNGLN